MVENWRPVVGAEGEYEVSDRGRVRSLARTVEHANRWGGRTTRPIPGRLLRPGVSGTGQLTVVPGRSRGSRTIHSLVLEAFVGPCPPGMIGRHRDRNPERNVLENLYYAPRRRWPHAEGASRDHARV